MELPQKMSLGHRECRAEESASPRAWLPVSFPPSPPLFPSRISRESLSAAGGCYPSRSESLVSPVFTRQALAAMDKPPARSTPPTSALSLAAEGHLDFQLLRVSQKQKDKYNCAGLLYKLQKVSQSPHSSVSDGVRLSWDIGINLVRTLACLPQLPQLCLWQLCTRGPCALHTQESRPW